VKFKVDENLPEELTQLFRDQGWDSLSVYEEKLGGEVDPTIEEVCEGEKRILVTFDRGFANIKATHAQVPGFIVFRLRSQDKSNVLRVAARVIRALAVRPLQNELWIVHETRIRIRLLKLSSNSSPQPGSTHR